MALLELNWLGLNSILPFWTFIGIMSHLFAFKTLYQAEVLLVGFGVEILATIFFHPDVVPIIFIQSFCLGSFFGHLFWAFIGIMALVVALEAKHLNDISLGFKVMLVDSQLPLLFVFFKG